MSFTKLAAPGGGGLEGISTPSENTFFHYFPHIHSLYPSLSPSLPPSFPAEKMSFLLLLFFVGINCNGVVDFFFCQNTHKLMLIPKDKNQLYRNAMICSYSKIEQSRLRFTPGFYLMFLVPISIFLQL
jgi:hypothetical protein